jgi:ABC-type nitrate/sulfonate/bicarbonate transport system permease component
VVGDSVIQGILVALFLSLTIWVGQFWAPYPGKSQIGYKVFIVLAAMILLINRASGYTFERAATERGAALVEELKCDNWNSFFGASTLVMICLLLWQGFTGSIFRSSPIEMLIGLYGVLFGGEFFRDIYVSFVEIASGLVLSGGTAAFLVFILSQAGKLKSIFDTILQAVHVAPIALLPGVMGSQFLFYQWSAVCVAVFCFYAFARAFWGLRYYSILPRTLLSLDDALPYGAAAIVYGEAMHATAGLSFAMVVAGATYQTAKGLASFVTLLFLVAALSTLLRWLAKTSLRRSLTAS